MGSPTIREELEEIVAEFDYAQTVHGEAIAILIESGHPKYYRVAKPEFPRKVESLGRHRFSTFRNGRQIPRIYSRGLLREMAEAAAAIANEGPVLPGAGLRVGVGDLNSYYDLGPGRGVVHLTPTGFSVEDSAPVPIFQTSSIPLAIPKQGGDWKKLLPYLSNMGADDQLKVVAFCVQCLLGRPPFPFLSVAGGAGSGKTMLAKTILTLLDPGDVSRRPKNAGDLAAAATKRYILAYDNLSSLRNLSDDFCVMSTGGTFAGRSLYTDDDIRSAYVCRPVIFTGINHVITRGDLADRSLFINLKRGEDPRSESELRRALAQDAPDIFGGLCTLACNVLARLPAVKLPAEAKSLRFPDFVRLSIVIELELGQPSGTMVAVLLRNARDGAQSITDELPWADALFDMLEARVPIERMPAAELFRRMSGHASFRGPSSPKNHSMLSKRLLESVTDFRHQNVLLLHDRDKRSAFWTIRFVNSQQRATHTETGNELAPAMSEPENLPHLRAIDEPETTTSLISHTESAVLDRSLLLSDEVGAAEGDPIFQDMESGLPFDPLEADGTLELLHPIPGSYAGDPCESDSQEEAELPTLPPRPAIHSNNHRTVESATKADPGLDTTSTSDEGEQSPGPEGWEPQGDETASVSAPASRPRARKVTGHMQAHMISLRLSGWSIAHIAEVLEVSESTVIKHTPPQDPLSALKWAKRLKYDRESRELIAIAAAEAKANGGVLFDPPSQEELERRKHKAEEPLRKKDFSGFDFS